MSVCLTASSHSNKNYFDTERTTHETGENHDHRGGKRRRDYGALVRRRGIGRHRPAGHPANGKYAQGKGPRPVPGVADRGLRRRIVGTTSYADTAGSDVVVITAGMPRKPGMSRDDLLATNAKIVAAVAEQVKGTSPEAIVIVVSNPLDAMVQRAWQVTGFPPRRVLGQAGVSTPPDSARSLPSNSASASRTYRRCSWADTATRWCRCPVARRSAASPSRN